MIVGRYVIGEAFASGGMGTVHLGRIHGAGGFSRVVAVKRLFPTYAGDEQFRHMLLDEARLASRIRHPNVVPTLDVVEAERDLYLVMEYVHGVSLAAILTSAREPIPMPIAVAILEGALAGLHAAHEARGEDGTPLGIVHRDVSPQNILVGADGIVRIIDFGVAKAATQRPATEPGVVKGKTAYMAPEQLRTEQVSRHADVFSAAAVLWEVIAGRRLVDEHPGEGLAARLLRSETVPPSRHRQGVDPRIDAVVLRALALRPNDRFPSAEAMAIALRDASPPAHAAEIVAWLQREAADELELSEERVRLLEQAGPESAPGTAPGLVVSSEGGQSEAAHLQSGLTPSERSAAATKPDGRPRQGVMRRVAIAVSVTVLAALAIFIVRANVHAPVNTLSAANAAPSIPPPAPAAPSATIATQAAPPIAALPIPPASASASATVRTAPNPKTPVSRTGRGNKRCDPPFTLDANGRKHYDPSCF